MVLPLVVLPLFPEFVLALVADVDVDVDAPDSRAPALENHS